MPPPSLPLTPASSTEIHGKDGSQFASLQLAFELPPAAVLDSRPSSASTKASSASSYHPTSPKSPAIPASETVKTRRRSSAAQTVSKDAFALPPPPTRNRKIIQMKPRGQSEVGNNERNTGMVGKVVPIAPKKKQPSATSAAGRKIARKTAHSLIERRRRSKMNEEFGVLKDMIPACTGEMHKLAILQASIDYIRYLEDCVAKLKAENDRTISNSTPSSDAFMLPPAARQGSYNTARQDQPHEEDEDIEMGDQTMISSKHCRAISNSCRPSLSPAMLPHDSRNLQDSSSSISTDPRRYSFNASTTTSPALLPGIYDYSRPGSALTSPALHPQRNLDEEATAALLMLNTDRRGINGSMGGRGLSVKDLLSP
ncbi:hypothetical protein B0O99DRAFT_515800 [Bisporella sp. PMI_857]|nr:hypothetical protein B0O99DRAFT_515800 [Bisporella sp. PMI_857]